MMYKEQQQFPSPHPVGHRVAWADLEKIEQKGAINLRRDKGLIHA
jgi:hypothetical protein